MTERPIIQELHEKVDNLIKKWPVLRVPYFTHYQVEQLTEVEDGLFSCPRSPVTG